MYWENIYAKYTHDKKHNWQVQNRQGEIKNNIGNVEAKELICMTHGHELKGGKWDNCNSIINKYIFKIPMKGVNHN